MVISQIFNFFCLYFLEEHSLNAYLVAHCYRKGSIKVCFSLSFFRIIYNELFSEGFHFNYHFISIIMSSWILMSFNPL